jgi:hypothetical protein
MERCRVYYKGEGGGFPQVQAVVSLVCPCCPWFVLAPKVLQLCTNHLMWVVCRPVWVSETCQLFLVPSWSSNTPLYLFKVLWARERASTPPLSTVFHLDSFSNPSKSWECVIKCKPNDICTNVFGICMSFMGNKYWCPIHFGSIYNYIVFYV